MTYEHNEHNDAIQDFLSCSSEVPSTIPFLSDFLPKKRIFSEGTNDSNIMWCVTNLEIEGSCTIFMSLEKFSIT